MQWLGPRGVNMTVDHYEIRDGGTWRYTHADDEGNEYGFHGVFAALSGGIVLAMKPWAPELLARTRTAASLRPEIRICGSSGY